MARNVIVLFLLLGSALFAEGPDLAEIAATRALWPREVTLRAAVSVPVYFEGREAGAVPIPAGRILKVIKVEVARITLDLNGSPVVVAPSQTDLVQRVLTAVSSRPPSGVTTPAAAVVVPIAPRPSPPAAAAPATTPVIAAAVPVSPGWHRRVHLPSLPDAPLVMPGVQTRLKAETEEFDLYLPRDFDPKRPVGLIVYVSPADNPDIPDRYTALWDEHQIVVIGAYRSGNPEKEERRAGLAVSAQLALRRLYEIDPKRVFVSGMSGGGRMSTRLGLMAPQYFKGVLAHCGADFYKDYPVTQKTAQGNRTWQGRNWTAFSGNQHATPASLVQARAETRFVLLSGPEDTARNHEDWESAMKSDGFKTLLVMEPGLGHTFCNAESYRRGLEFVLGLGK